MLRIFMSKEQRTAEDVNKLMAGTFNTELGEKLLHHLATIFIDRPMYSKGMTLEEVAFRQGEASVIEKIIREVKRNGNR